MMSFFERVKKNEDIRTYIKKADETLLALGYTEHSFAHVTRVCDRAAYILQTLGYSEHDVELVQIAAYLHDIGNIVNRISHSQSGAIMAFRLLDKMDMPPEDIARVVAAIGNHDEGTGVPIDALCAALIIADKSDVRRSRVRSREVAEFDIHDRVNYSAERSEVTISQDKKTICLSLTIATDYSSIMDYFEIFLERMLLCQRAARTLGLKFKLEINGQQIL